LNSARKGACFNKPSEVRALGGFFVVCALERSELVVGGGNFPFNSILNGYDLCGGWLRRSLMEKVLKIAAVIATGAFSVVVLGILRKNIAEFGARFFRYRKISKMASDLVKLELANGMSSQSIATILQRHENSWVVDRLVDEVSQCKIRKSNGYEPEDEIQFIRYQLQQMVDASKKYGWTPSQ
jgi:hypothetical protein